MNKKITVCSFVVVIFCMLASVMMKYKEKFSQQFIDMVLNIQIIVCLLVGVYLISSFILYMKEEKKRRGDDVH
jgi:ABC-type Mn2+/Zn2+ transport system permease subunit